MSVAEHPPDADAARDGEAPSALRQQLDDPQKRERELHAAIASRDILGQAKGILMERDKVTAEEAFDVLCHRSQHLNLKVALVAEHLATTGELMPCPCVDGATTTADFSSSA